MLACLRIQHIQTKQTEKIAPLFPLAFQKLVEHAAAFNRPNWATSLRRHRNQKLDS